ncbi:DUF4752 family protein [Salmonella enterica]|nr:DUF4752 family protein [Salmonella enterica]EBM6970290.1 DUF4752 family protein [Salmonella enterica]EEL2512159.1 DUF4752 family protein [Salmonella enterica]EGK0772178.1 DUF4752 family protein [Salmonella enterica]EJF0846099.1 DUF4752 family protein [Salmonella enterica]
MKDLLVTLNVGLSLLGYAYIMFKTFQWILTNALKQWDKRRKVSAKQKAVDALYEAYELDKVSEGDTVKVATKEGLVIMICRYEKTNTPAR